MNSKFVNPIKKSSKLALWIPTLLQVLTQQGMFHCQILLRRDRTGIQIFKKNLTISRFSFKSSRYGWWWDNQSWWSRIIFAPLYNEQKSRPMLNLFFIWFCINQQNMNWLGYTNCFEFCAIKKKILSMFNLSIGAETASRYGSGSAKMMLFKCSGSYTP
jgi:hypothetical protein